MSSTHFTIRAHHGLCGIFFRGYGYSDGFSRRMAQVLAALKEGGTLTLADSADDICIACPHRRGTGCASMEKPQRYDQQVLALCGLAPGDTLTWADFTEKVQKNILAPGLRTQVCGDCQWNDLCTRIERGE